MQTTQNLGVTQAAIVRFAKSFSRRHRTAPTIKRFCSKFNITNRRFYELFPNGLEEICEKAGIDVPPRIHMADRANDKRKTNDKSTIQSQSEQTAEPDPQLKPLVEANSSTKSDLTHRQKEVALMQEHSKLSRQLKEVTKHKDALTMVQDSKVHIEKMFTYASEYPAIEKEINASLKYLHGPLTTEQLRTEKERIFAERYDALSNTIKTYPYYMKLVGRDGEYEVRPDFIDTELQAVLADLRLDVNVKRYTRWSNVKPDYVCAHDHTRFRYVGNGVFACQRKHQTFYKCPECASKLDYLPEYNTFTCHPCFTKLMDS